MAWDPNLYLVYERYRRQPAVDLLARIDLDRPASVYDLGCGPGNVTALLKQRWPEAEITGVDNSPDMLARARAHYPAIRWTQENITTFTTANADLIFSNAAFNWVPDHGKLVAGLAKSLATGGVLAVQMPRNYAQPSHAEIVACVESLPARHALRPLIAFAHVQPPAFYHDILTPLVEEMEMWETNYIHVLHGDDPVLEWVMGTALRPVVEALEGIEKESFVEDMRQRYRAAYPKQPDGTTLFAMQRLFVLARR
ncbi:MAG: methyltransferase domain-containing protein [Alphaproteobacteria bacterium]